MIDLNNALVVAKSAALVGREILLDYFGQLSKVSEKSQAGLVSEADVESEKAISLFLRQKFPSISILGEEGSYLDQGESLAASTKADALWLIDPLDGTTNYIHKLPVYCVSIGLQIEGQLVVGVCDIPAIRSTYTARKGGGAYRDDQRLSVSRRSTLHESLLATGFSSYDHSREQLEIFGSLVREVRGLRRLGSAAYDLCLVAEGIYDGYWEKNLSPWDTAAGALIVQEAGGVVTQYESESYSPFDKTIVAGNPVIHNHLKSRILSFYKKTN